MSTLRLKPEAAAARRAARAASMPASKPIVAPDAIVQAVAAFPAAQVKGLLKTEHTPLAGAPSGKAAKKAAMRDLQRRLKAIWPHLFSRDDIPLAIGIRQQIEPHLTEDERRWLPAVLHQHTHRPAYINALTQPGAHRVGLDGSLSEISAEQVAHAKGASA